MFGARSYGSSSYGGLTKQQPILVFTADAFNINASLKTPTYLVTELVGFLSIEATLLPPTVNLLNHEIIIKVNTVDISDQVVFNSLTISNNLYSDPDSAVFDIIKSSNKTYTPQAGDTITIEDMGTKVFAGVMIKTTKSLTGFAERYTLEFKDWTDVLGNFLVDEVYTNDTVANIIADIFSDAGLSDFDGTTHVSDTTNVSRIVFDNIPVADALDQLAELSGKHWYVSPDKEIYFFADSGIPAPFNLTDISGNYDYHSLRISEDLTQIRNSVTVKGNGIASVNEQDATSIATYGLREYFLRDDEINATSEATQLAQSIIANFKDPINIIEFDTRESGLFSGQQIDIDSDQRGINETLNIENVTFISREPNRFIYRVRATSQRLLGIEDLFTKQLETPDNTPSVGNQGSLQNVEFTAIDDETIQWSSGTIILSDGTTYSIDAKASQVLTGDHVIYFDPDTSETVLQISTNFADGIGARKIPLCYATKSAVATKGADIFPVTFGGKIQIDGGTHITDKSIITDNIASNAVTANEISVIQLSSISANIGTITAGSITGVTVASSSGNNRIELTNGDLLKFYYGGSEEGYIYNDSSGNMVIDADNLVYIKADGAGDDVYLDAGDDIAIDAGDTVFISSNSRFADLTGDDISLCDKQVVYYNEDQDGSFCQWREGGGVKMQLDDGGDLYVSGDVSADNVDFAEMFESFDGNKINNGTSVVFENGNKIREASEGEIPFGVVSGTAAIVLGNGVEWNDKYVRDELGEFLTEKVEWWRAEVIEKIKKKTGKKQKVQTIERKKTESGWMDEKKPPKDSKILTKKIVERKILNKNYDKTKKFIKRSDRKEWNKVGLIGRVRILKGQPVANNWIKLRKISDKVSEYLIK